MKDNSDMKFFNRQYEKLFWIIGLGSLGAIALSWYLRGMWP